MKSSSELCVCAGREALRARRRAPNRPLPASFIAQHLFASPLALPCRYDANFCWRPELDVAIGDPLGLAVRTSAHSWVRNFTRANVAVDVSAGRSGAVDLLA